jgi:hypothetical protein
MDKLTEGAITVLMAIVGVAILSVLVSQRSNTANVLAALGSSFSQMLGAATGPVTQGGGGLSFPSLGMNSAGFAPITF